MSKIIFHTRTNPPRKIRWKIKYLCMSSSNELNFPFFVRDLKNRIDLFFITLCFSVLLNFLYSEENYAKMIISLTRGFLFERRWMMGEFYKFCNKNFINSNFSNLISKIFLELYPWTKNLTHKFSLTFKHAPRAKNRFIV